MPTVGSLAWALIADNTRFAAGTSAARKNTRGLHADLVSLKGALTSVAGPAGFLAVTAGITGAATAAGMFIKEGVRMSAALEQLNVQMEVMTGSRQTGGALLGEMVQLAKETPFALEDVASAGKVLLAMGSAAGDVTRQVRMLGDVSAATGQPVAQLAQVFGEVQQAGRLTSNELRQFNMRGIPLLSELSEMLGVSKTELREMVTEGEVTADSVEKAFERMTSAGGRFADMMGRQAETLTGQWEKFKDSLSLAAAAAAGDPGTTGTLSSFLKRSLGAGGQFLDAVGEGGALFQSQGMGAFTQEGRAQFAMDRINKQVADAMALKNATANPTIEAIGEDEDAKDLAEDMTKFLDNLQMDVDTFGMASDAAKLFELRMRGVDMALVDQAQQLIENKARLEDAKKRAEEAEKASKKEMDSLTKLRNASLTDAEKLGEEFGDIVKLSHTKAGFENPFVIQRGLEDLQDRIRGKLEGPAATQSTAAIRAGSIEAVRAQFSGNVTQKQLKEAEKQTREQEIMRGLLEDISEKIQGITEAPG